LFTFNQLLKNASFTSRLILIFKVKFNQLITQYHPAPPPILPPLAGRGGSFPGFIFLFFVLLTSYLFNRLFLPFIGTSAILVFLLCIDNCLTLMSEKSKIIVNPPAVFLAQSNNLDRPCSASFLNYTYSFQHADFRNLHCCMLMFCSSAQDRIRIVTDPVVSIRPLHLKNKVGEGYGE
jgi:hypothetical protein